MKKIVYWMMVGMAAGLILMFSAGGCSEQQLDKADQAATAVQGVVQGVDQIVKSPAGSFIPPQILAITQGVISGILVLFGIYTENKSRLRGAVLKSVVKAVDQAASQPKQEIKNNVAANLTKEKIAAQGSAMIAKIKEG